MRIDGRILRHCWILAGPTACGKSCVSLELAERLGSEIVALDSMSLYRGMDIGTAKVTPVERAQIPHHLVDVIDPADEFSVADYVSAAAEVCEDILCRGRTPLFVGGTGLYLRSILRGVFEGPPADWEFRRRMENLAGKAPGTLHRKLQECDRETAARLHPNDHRRIIRALEVYEVTGSPLSKLQQLSALPVESRPQHVFWLSPPREWLYQRIDARVLQMIDDGLVDEVRSLLDKDPPLGRTARQALGYREMISHLHRQCTLEEAIMQIQSNTRQFAKRQHTWFRNLEECRPIRIDGSESVVELVDRLVTAADDPAPRTAS